jgi:hypothetical protein
MFTRGGPTLPPLAPAPKVAELPTPIERHGCRYLGTVAGDQRVRARSLGSAGSARIQVSAEGVDVVRLAGSFRIPVTALRSARDAAEFDGKSAGPQGALVIRWEHGERVLDSGFRLQLAAEGSAAEVHRRWARSVNKVVRDTHG